MLMSLPLSMQRLLSLCNLLSQHHALPLLPSTLRCCLVCVCFSLSVHEEVSSSTLQLMSSNPSAKQHVCVGFLILAGANYLNGCQAANLVHVPTMRIVDRIKHELLQEVTYMLGINHIFCCFCLCEVQNGKGTESGIVSSTIRT